MNQKILFICRHNAGRSVIAESLAKQYLPSQFAVASGGSHPTGSINPVVKHFLQNKNLPVPHNYAHSWEERTAFLPDIVITLCDSLHNEPTPLWLSGGIRVHWQADAFPQQGDEQQLSAHCDLLYESLQRRIIAMSNVLQQTDLNDQDLKDELAKLNAM